jgi:DMSO/TMAO reductase YedYZ molybdopterin-dependent catalytic subunit
VPPPLDTVTDKPHNAETPWTGLLPTLTPNDSFFVRNHFDEPVLDPSVYHLRIAGEVERAKAYTLPMLERLPPRRVTCVLECAGNGRSRMMPKPKGVAWGDRAVGCATWEGPSLRDALAACPPNEGIVEAVFRGADLGIEGDVVAQFERSLPIADCLAEGPLLALRMNGAPLSRAHGAPVRLVVPGHYGVASVKWLTDVRYASKPFTGYFQRQRYVWDDGSPVREMRVKSALLRPHPGEPLRAGMVKLEGRAWASGGIAEVRVQVDDGPWIPADLGPQDGPAAWRAWSLQASFAAGTRRVRVRARDSAGIWQPLDGVVNRLGYGYNTVATVELLVGP